METRAPAVVAVVVTTGHAPFLEATLASLRAQDYAELSVLVLANGPSDGLEAAVTAGCPGAFVRELETNQGFGPACNESLAMVEGAAFLCLCHDDVTLAPDAVHQMVEEAYRSNAGIVTPKFVRADDPTRLLHVGLNADRFGATTERVEVGEVDQGQHDTARDVFVAPGGATLVRADLFAILGGFDPAIAAMGEDLDLCWRAQVAGSRVVVAPTAVVEHRETLANALRPLTADVQGAGAASLSSLARRHRLRTMLTCYGAWTLLLSSVILVTLEVGEAAVAFLGRDRERFAAVAGSWRWNLAHLGELRRRRKAVRNSRALDDHEIRRLQVAGASRLSTFGSRLVHQGVDVARGALSHVAPVDDDERIDHTVGFGAAFSDDQSFDELDDLGHRGGGLTMRLVTSRGAQVTVGLLVVALFAVGVRNLVAAHLPVIGRLAPLDSWTTNWRLLFASWTPAGVGSGAAGSPAYGVLGIAGTLVFGRMGLLVRAVLLGAIPLGGVGAWRLLRNVGTRRARLAGAVAYVVLALGPNFVAAGRLDELVAFGLLPFVVDGLLTVAGVHPFAGRVDPQRGGFAPWRARRTGRLVLLGSLLALVAALDPSAAVATAAAAIGLAAGGMAAGAPRSRLGSTATGAIGVAVVLLAPLTVDALASGTAGVGVFGAATGPWSQPGLGGLLRLAVGPFGHGVFSWLLPAAALVVLWVGRGERLLAAARLAGMGVASVLLALLVARNLLGDFTPDVGTLLVPYALSVAGLVGTGIAAFEQDVPAARFGWRQLAASSAVAAVLLGAVPFVQSISTGRFDLPQYGFDAELAGTPASTLGGSRTLWLGDPRALPLDSWSVEPGLAFATTTAGLPREDDLLAPPSSGAAAVVASDVLDAINGRTVFLGRLLAAAGIRAVVVVDAIAPSLAGERPTPTPPPPALTSALRRQLDLAGSPGAGSGVVTYAVTEAHGIVAARAQALASSAPASSASSVRGWRPALGTWTWSGEVDRGALLASLAPAGDFSATVDGVPLQRGTAFRWASTWSVSRAGFASLRFRAPPLNAVLAAVTLAGWALVLLAALGGGRVLRLRRPRREQALEPLSAAGESD